MATRTPWGPAQVATKIAPGIMFYSTAGHGGYHISDRRRLTMPPALHDFEPMLPGWYEEDCEWAVVYLAFPQEMMQHDGMEQWNKVNAMAATTLANYCPDTWEKHFGIELRPGESHVKDERMFMAEHAEDWVAITAYGDWHERVPKGYVGICATKGGRRHILAMVEAKYFLIPVEEYDARGPFAFFLKPDDIIYDQIDPL
jgi:hypothetical protein